MITGTVSSNREAVVRLEVQGTNGQTQEVEAVVDTGFTGQFTLPPAIIASLGLTWMTQGQAVMANGHIETFNIYASLITWDNQPLRVLAEEADTEPLIGMSLLYGYKLTMEAVDGGTVTIESLS